MNFWTKNEDLEQCDVCSSFSFSFATVKLMTFQKISDDCSTVLWRRVLYAHLKQKINDKVTLEIFSSQAYLLTN